MLEAPTIYSMLGDDEAWNQFNSRRALLADEYRKAADLKQRASFVSLKALLEREYLHEKELYSIDKRIANLMTDMGFAIADQSADSQGQGTGKVGDVTSTKFHRLVKRTDKHMIVVTYQLRSRLLHKMSTDEQIELQK